MVIERLVWRAKFGRGDEVASAFKEWRRQFGERTGLKTRILVDATGPMFTVVVENEYRDLVQVAESDAQMQAQFSESDFQQWFTTWQGSVESGSRELYTVVE